MKFEALNFLDSVGKEDYKAFLLQNFEVGMLFDLDNSFIFDGWTGTEMVGCWYKADNFETKSYIEFYDTFYNVEVKKGNKREKYTFPYPRTINDFITDCNRCGIVLYYHMNALEKYKPITLLTGKSLDEYYTDVLIKIEKL